MRPELAARWLQGWLEKSPAQGAAGNDEAAGAGRGGEG